MSGYAAARAHQNLVNGEADTPTLPWDLLAACENNGIDATLIAGVELEITGENEERQAVPK